MPREREREREEEDDEAERRSAPSGRTVHQAILVEGEAELRRSSAALFWSAVAAGLSMGFSVITEALLRTHLVDAGWTPLVSKLGYSVGFLIVVLGRQQLFTENTLTPVLPLLVRKDAATLRAVARLWGVVLIANLVGCVAVAAVIARSSLLDPAALAEVGEIAREALAPGALTTFWRAVFAGWLIALMVWLLPFAESARVLVIVVLTYVIGLGDFSHVIAGSIPVVAHGLMGAGE